MLHTRFFVSGLKLLVPLIAITGMITSGVGLFSQGGDGPFHFTTIHGNIVDIDGQGIYRNDSLFVGALLRGTDAVALLHLIIGCCRTKYRLIFHTAG